CGQHGRRPGDRGDPHVPFDRRRDQPVPRVGHRGHTGVGHQQHPRPAGQLLHQLGGARGLVALEVRHHTPPGRHPERLGQPAQPPRVLGRDDVRRGQLLGEPGRGVGDVADGGACEYERSGHAPILAAPAVRPRRAPDPATGPMPGPGTGAGGAQPGHTAHARDSHSPVPYDGAVTSTASSTDSTDTRQHQPPLEQRTAWQLRLRRFGYLAKSASSGREDVRDRLVPPYAEPSGRLWATLSVPPAAADRIARWSGWGGPLLVTLLAGVLRFWNLGSPRAVIFDETYYAKDAWALIHRGFEVNWSKNANDRILESAGNVPIPTDAAYVVHPPVGKYVIGLG